MVRMSALHHRSVRNVVMSIHQRGLRGPHPRFTALSAVMTSRAAYEGTGAAGGADAAECSPWSSLYPPTSVHFQYCLHTSIIAVHRQRCFEMLVCFVCFFLSKQENVRGLFTSLNNVKISPEWHSKQSYSMFLRLLHGETWWPDSMPRSMKYQQNSFVPFVTFSFSWRLFS